MTNAARFRNPGSSFDTFDHVANGFAGPVGVPSRCAIGNPGNLAVNGTAEPVVFGWTRTVSERSS